MKVICIDASRGKTTNKVVPFKEGQILNVFQSPEYIDSYIIVEYPYNEAGGYWSFYKSRFIPLSTIDETEMKRENILQLNS